MTREEALVKVRGYLTNLLPIEDYDEVDEIMLALEQQPCEDCISRSYIINELIKHQHSMEFCTEHHIDHSIDLGMAAIVVNNAPSVTPARKKGEWGVAIGYDPKRSFMCDCCMKMAYEPTPYCPYCGAEMEVDDEDSN